MTSNYITFTKDFDYLVDNIKNGFKMLPNEIKIEKNQEFIMNEILSIYESLNLTIPPFGEILEFKKNNDESGFNKFKKDKTTDYYKLAMLLNDFKFSVNMKCFTELRDNQKIAPHHTEYFGEYGIIVSEKWMSKHNASPVIYTSKNNKLGKKIGVLTTFIESLTLGNINIKDTLMSFLSLMETDIHKHEYEWRIISDTFIDSVNKEERLSIDIEEIKEIFVTSKNEKDTIKKMVTGLSKSNYIPKISDTSEIILSKSDINKINKINYR